MRLDQLVTAVTLLFVSLSAFAESSKALATAPEKVSSLLNGMEIPNVIVKDAEGAPFSLQALIMQKPSIVLFYRGGWCPYCSRQLAGLKDIEQDLVNAGYQILAISPQSPAQLQEQKLEIKMAVKLLSDESLAAVTGFGVGYYLDSATQARYQGHGVSLTTDSTGKGVLPAPSLFFLDTAGVVQMSYVNPDFKVRPSSELVLAIAQALAKQR
ncbi:AhpC/TSA family protein [Alteromonas pelagimontana]|uniref:thioredoxin-dependent peroxiredoxin n=1 Tax=Alteromonas pelagimontana TaxID=1858656 RepID=A0A6M4MG20_9ALTE|nr:peroxiredoxin-like family protein [Alteromonas pelagimontana]QJR81146.1 AhpC/TSA family protein [Alteromonas pelagimontana]